MPISSLQAVSRPAGSTDGLVVDLVGPVAPPTGGIASHVEALAGGIASLGSTVRIHAPGMGWHGRVTRRMGRGAGWSILTRLATALPSGALVHGHSVLTAYPGFGVLGAFVRLLSAKRARWIETIHDGRLPDRYARWDSSSQRRYAALIQRADMIIAVSEPLRDFLVDARVASAKVGVVNPWLLPPAVPRSVRPSIEAFLARHAPVIVGVGAMIPLYDFDTMVAAFGELRADDRHAGLILLTSSFDDDARFRRRILGALGRMHGSAISVIDIPHDEARGLMQRADVVVRGPAKESYGLSRVEAMLAGTPVVATPVGEQEYIYAYEHGDVGSLVTALASALRPEPDRIAAAREYFEQLGHSNLRQLMGYYKAVVDD